LVDHFFEHPHHLRFLRSGATGAHIEAYASWLVEQGYSFNAGRCQLRGVGHLGFWMAENGLLTCDLDEATVDAFIAHVPTCRCVRRHKGQLHYCVAAARRFLAWARETGISLTVAPAVALHPLIEEFEAWMIKHRNVSPVSLRDCYRLQLCRFLDAVGDDPSTWNAGGIRKFILAQSQRTGSSRTKQAVTAVRGLLRYLAIVGRCPPELVHAPPTIANWRLSSLPTFVSPADVTRIIEACDPGTRSGRRDRAMVLLMARLGLRAGDVSALRLGDIDWAKGTLAVTGKSRRAARMPLPQDVGDAILAWLSDGRPEYDGDEVFVRLYAPVGPIDSSTAAMAAARAEKRAEVQVPRAGSHVLRHSAATALLNEGMSLPAVGALLRHAMLDTTTIYAKVDTTTLGTVARAWAGEVKS
jgi:integrase